MFSTSNGTNRAKIQMKLKASPSLLSSKANVSRCSCYPGGTNEPFNMILR